MSVTSTTASPVPASDNESPYALNVPLDRTDVEHLRALAKNSNRSLRGYVRHVLREHLASAA